ncbi:glycoside hydrolase family 25 protein [Russula dissimulans]|nr:glycoside hydrolase family 25 protein [Russula dissimulans]
MRLPSHLIALFALPVAAIASPLAERAQPLAIDVSNHQGTIDWTKVKGIEFVYIKATEGTDFIDSYFSNNHNAATKANLIRGAYHYAHPDVSSGAAQAEYFLAHGGGWTSDGITLPGAIDLEAGCYNLTPAQMVAWIKDFSDTYYSKTMRNVVFLHIPASPPSHVNSVIYATTSWWKQCTGNSAALGATNPLWIASWASAVGSLPAGWSYPTFWQYADSGSNPGDQDLFNGDSAGLGR